MINTIMCARAQPLLLNFVETVEEFSTSMHMFLRIACPYSNYVLGYLLRPSVNTVYSTPIEIGAI